MDTPDVPERFRVLELIASSETELLIRARDRVLLREVVLKRAGPALVSAFRSGDVRRQTLREARALARVRHPGVLHLIDVIETPDAPWLVMEPVVGEILAERLVRGGRMPPGEVLVLARQLAEALEAVHAVGIVHRALSSANIVLGPGGAPCITGFQFAKLGGSPLDSITASTSLYSSGSGENSASIALPPHPAPELLIGGAADSRSDLFALGWLLFECLTGVPPYGEDNASSWKEPRDASRLAPGAPAELVRALATCLAISPLKRFESASALRAALEGARGLGSDAGARSKSSRSRKAALAGLALAGVVALAFLVPGLLSDRGGATSVRAEGGDEMRGVSPWNVASASFDKHYASSYGLLIGIGAAYGEIGFPPLSNAEGDVQALAARLSAMPSEKWQLTSLLGADATRRGVLDALAKLAKRTRADDRVVVYYAGHGEASARSEKSGWIVPADATPAAQDPGRASWIRFDEFFDFFREASAKHVLVAMDCCYGGRLSAARSGESAAYEETFLTRPAHVVLASGRPFERVSDGVPGEHSPFARAILRSLGRPGPLTSSMLYAQIQASFIEERVGHSPVLSYPEGSPLGGEVVFFVE